MNYENFVDYATKNYNTNAKSTDLSALLCKAKLTCYNIIVNSEEIGNDNLDKTIRGEIDTFIKCISFLPLEVKRGPEKETPFLDDLKSFYDIYSNFKEAIKEYGDIKKEEVLNLIKTDFAIADEKSDGNGLSITAMSALICIFYEYSLDKELIFN